MWFGCSDVVAWHLKDPLSKRERDQKKWLDVKRKPFAFFFWGVNIFPEVWHRDRETLARYRAGGSMSECFDRF